MAKASLILSFYNKIEPLKLVLASLELQSEPDFEVIIADDGSKPEVVDELKALMAVSELSIKHCWHADEGWRKNKILNKALRETTADYFIFVDSDCLLHRHFVKEHLRYREASTVLAGRRVNLSERITRKLTPERIRAGYLNKILFDSLPDIITGKMKDFEQGFYLANTGVGDWLNRKDKGLLGSNFSISREDMFGVNGFDERFVHPAAGEDTDLERRLRRNGVTVNTVRNRAIQYHLYHEKLPRSEARLEFLKANDEASITYTPFGIEQDE